MNEPPPVNRDHDRDPNIKTLKRRGLINHGSTVLIASIPDMCLARSMEGIYVGDDVVYFLYEGMKNPNPKP